MTKSKKTGLAVGWVSIIVNLFLFIFKLWAGVVSGSVAMIADAWHTVSDSVTSAAVLVGFWVSGKSADEEHPFGHGRAENIAAIAISVIIGIIGFNFLIKSIGNILEFREANYGVFGLVVFASAAFLKEVMARVSKWAGNKINSNSLKADGCHHRIDAATSFLVVLGIFLSGRFWWIDGLMGIVISGAVIYASYELLKDSSDSILGRKLSPDIEKKIRKTVAEIAPEIKKVNHFHIHRYGDHSELTFHISLPGDMSLEDAHKIADKIEKEIRRKYKYEATIHAGPLSDH